MLPPKDQMEKYKQKRFRNPEEPTQEPMFPEFGPPEFDEEPKEKEVYDENELQNVYQDFSPELEELYDDFNEVNQETDENYLQKPTSYEDIREPIDYPEPPSMRQDGNAFLQDEPIFDGGPTRSEVLSWKKQFEVDGHSVNLTTIGEENFIWRTLSRTEYREIMALPNLDPLQREEVICEICVLFPYEYNFSTMANRKAGVPAILAEQIMHESGFKKVAPPIRL